MRTHFLSFRGAAIAVLLFTFIFCQNLQAQDAPASVYLEITKIKNMNDDLKSVHEEIITPFIQERIKQGNQNAHVLFRVYYPYSENAEYDYVMMDVFTDFNHLHLGNKKFMEIAKTTFPNAHIPDLIERYEAAVNNAGSEVFLMRDEAIPGPSGGSGKSAKFVQVNHMKVTPANGRDYVDMESNIFKPLHKARIEAGGMDDWVLAQRIMPYGSDWENNFLTFDVFTDWRQMEPKGSMSKMMKKIHPTKNPNDVWKKMQNLRELSRSETWEIVSVVNSPTPTVAYEVVKEGTGPKPMNGEEVQFVGTIMDTEGKTLISSTGLGFDFYNTLGAETYDRYFDKGMMKVGKGGVVKMTFPPDAQDKSMKAMGGGKTVVMKVEVKNIAAAKPNGTNMLKRKIKKHGLGVAMEKYKKLKANNPKGYAFREGAMNMLGYQLMGQGDLDAALFIFKENQKNYPKSWNACDSLADGYRAKGNLSKAKHCYEMALKIKPDFQAAKNKLNELAVQR